MGELPCRSNLIATISTATLFLTSSRSFAPSQVGTKEPPVESLLNPHRNSSSGSRLLLVNPSDENSMMTGRPSFDWPFPTSRFTRPFDVQAGMAKPPRGLFTGTGDLGLVFQRTVTVGSRPALPARHTAGTSGLAVYNRAASGAQLGTEVQVPALVRASLPPDGMGAATNDCKGDLRWQNLPVLNPLSRTDHVSHLSDIPSTPTGRRHGAEWAAANSPFRSRLEPEPPGRGRDTRVSAGLSLPIAIEMEWPKLVSRTGSTNP
jgi:hypothetical protein